MSPKVARLAIKESPRVMVAAAASVMVMEGARVARTRASRTV